VRFKVYFEAIDICSDLDSFLLSDSLLLFDLPLLLGIVLGIFYGIFTILYFKGTEVNWF
jgi:hypothetical protein